MHIRINIHCNKDLYTMDHISHGTNYSCRCYIDDTDLCKACSKLLDDHDEHCDLCNPDIDKDYHRKESERQLKQYFANQRNKWEEQS